jgi:hypothetical protein
MYEATRTGVHLLGFLIEFLQQKMGLTREELERWLASQGGKVAGFSIRMDEEGNARLVDED